MPSIRENEDIKKLPEAVQKKLFDFIEKEIPNTKFFKRDGKPKKEWKIFYGKDWNAARDSARASALASARASARDSARASAWDSALASAWASARASARASAWASARASAWDSSLLASFIVVSDLDFKDKEKHLAHVKARWEVWQKGYGLFCDMDGVLYVYCKGTKPKE